MENLVTDPKRTKLVAPDTTSPIKLRILRDVADPRSTDSNNPTVLLMGTIVELPYKEAKELLSRKYAGMYTFSGERPGTEPKGVIRVAEKYVEPVAEELETA